MSTDFRPLKRICARDLFDGRLEKFDIRELRTDKTTETQRILADSHSCIWVYIDDADFVIELTAYGYNRPSKILATIANVFNTDIVSEYEPQYWGFDSQQHWEAWLVSMAKEPDEKFYVELMKFLRGEPNGISLGSVSTRPGSVGMKEAEIAKALVEKDPTLLLLENKDRLLSEMRSIYYHGHANTLCPENILTFFNRPPMDKADTGNSMAAIRFPRNINEEI